MADKRSVFVHGKLYSFVSGTFGRSISGIFVACRLLLGAFVFALFLRVLLCFAFFVALFH